MQAQGPGTRNQGECLSVCLSVRSSPHSFPVGAIPLRTSPCSRSSPCPLGGSKKALSGAEGFAGLHRPSPGNLQGTAGVRPAAAAGQVGKTLKTFGCIKSKSFSSSRRFTPLSKVVL